MSVGFVMMAHAALDRAAEVALHLAGQGCPVVIHVDKRVEPAAYFDLVRRVSGQPRIHLAPRIACDWGQWSLVEASRTASAYLLARAPEVRHVYLISGACLPIRPVAELIAHLDAHPDTDFIESVTTEDVRWTMGGLSEERFTLTFPFAWKRQRRLFDLWVEAQRRLGYKRIIPEGIKPHMGSQWWCLTRRTLEAILADREAPLFDDYFSRVWIPDESYYATLARRHARRIESRSLTLAKFDFQGKPHLFYDDHLPLLQDSPAFFARKIWPGARKLYGAFLGPHSTGSKRKPSSGDVDRTFSAAIERRTRGRAGLNMVGRLPNGAFEGHLTAAPYAVFHGFDTIYRDFSNWTTSTLGATTHGHLFAPDGVEFTDGLDDFAGGLSAAPLLRDYNPEAFLSNLIWSMRDDYNAFLFAARDRQRITDFLARDANATVAMVSGTWALPLMGTGKPAHQLRRQAARLQQREIRFMELLRERRTRARVRIWSLAEVLENPALPLRAVLEDHSVPGAAALTVMPVLRDLEALPEFLKSLRDMGMNPHTAGPILSADAVPATPSAQELG
ncbi:MAG: beta-1,6-N-acetylglucosaminyltransferase [Boseongicola sp.]|nr:beta-1,6-N-acetylglucosaminyltransferase [Boseongicola sp.]